MNKVEQVVEKLHQAMINADKSALENVVADELSYGHASGVVEDKTAFVDAITSGRNDYATIDTTEQTINMSGDVAIVRHHFKAEILIEGKKAQANLSVMQIWQRQTNNWKLLARHAFRLNT